MNVEERISVLSQLGGYLHDHITSFEPILREAYLENPWFTIENSKSALTAIRNEFLDEGALYALIGHHIIPSTETRKVGLVLAGNIPLVGWHDIMCTFLAGHQSVIKYSSKDKILIPELIKTLEKIDSRTASYFSSVEQLKDIDAIIATGGDTAATHFNYYFGKYPNIIRKNRSSVGIITGDESKAELEALMSDVFQYFGLGCRSISKIFVPRDYDLNLLFEASLSFHSVIDHNKYKNNYDYNNAMYLLSRQDFLTNDFLILLEDSNIASRIACLHYEYYDEVDNLEAQLNISADDIQCMSSIIDIGSLRITPLGKCQQPKIDDFADNIDTLQFLTGL